MVDIKSALPEELVKSDTITMLKRGNNFRRDLWSKLFIQRVKRKEFQGGSEGYLSTQRVVDIKNARAEEMVFGYNLHEERLWLEMSPIHVFERCCLSH